MEMISQDIREMQEAVSNSLCRVPIALSNGDGCVYTLVKELSPDLEKFILTGETELNEFQVFPDGVVDTLPERMAQCGLKVGYISQRMEYMHRTVTINCPRVSAKGTDINVYLIPWFSLPDRPYPVFAYIYAIWHYNVSEKKSQRLSAAATGKVFGIESFNKSTVCRNIKAMGVVFENPVASGAASGESDVARSNEDLIGFIPKMLECCLSAEALGEVFGSTVAPVPERVNTAPKTVHALESIPQDYSKVAMDPPPAGIRRRDTRKRQARPYRPPENRVQRPLIFADSEKIKQIRRDFIAACMPIVVGYATGYRKFLL